jgi:hypothetical protein
MPILLTVNKIQIKLSVNSVEVYSFTFIKDPTDLVCSFSILIKYPPAAN